MLTILFGAGYGSVNTFIAMLAAEKGIVWLDCRDHGGVCYWQLSSIVVKMMRRLCWRKSGMPMDKKGRTSLW
ncbi:MAG: hypothetical protein PUB49_10790 [Selenomonadaceae bacterium]|nr:hypothetical protein [Selenomonadaceae bacterium]